ncbi:hypothetical protein WDW37_11150, partial [Bdellovibrionota bacterium FG-1]
AERANYANPYIFSTRPPKIEDFDGVNFTPASRQMNILSVNGIPLIDHSGNWVGPATGLQGPKGATGAAGPAGPQGIAGLKGDKGDAGAQGATGLPGLTGPQGAQGAAGAAGPMGANGIPGPAGMPGPMGAQGMAGIKGDTGAAGPMGVAGPAGPAGANGIPGPVGPQGPSCIGSTCTGGTTFVGTQTFKGGTAGIDISAGYIVTNAISAPTVISDSLVLVQGAFAQKPTLITTPSANYSMTMKESLVLVKNGGFSDISTITLPNANATNFNITIKNHGYGTVKIVPAAPNQTIDGSAVYTLAGFINAQQQMDVGESLTIVSDGNFWSVIGRVKH